MQVIVPESHGLGQDGFGDVDRSCRVAPQGSVFASRCGRWAKPLQLIDLIRDALRLLEEFGCVSLSTAGSYRAKHRQRDAATGRCDP